MAKGLQKKNGKVVVVDTDVKEEGAAHIDDDKKTGTELPDEIPKKAKRSPRLPSKVTRSEKTPAEKAQKVAAFPQKTFINRWGWLAVSKPVAKALNLPMYEGTVEKGKATPKLAKNVDVMLTEYDRETQAFKVKIL